MKTFRMLFFILVSALNFISTSYLMADEIHLKNGDRISGEVLNMKDNKLTVKTSYAGEIGIQWSEIISMKTDQEFSIFLNNNTKFKGNIQYADDGKLKVSSNKMIEPVAFSITEVASINSLKVQKTKIKARASLGLDSIRGNSNRDRSYFDGTFSLRTEMNRYTIGGELNRTESSGIETENNSLGYLKYDHFLSKYWFIYSNIRYEKDKLKDLSLRSVYGIGSGYQFYETPVTNLYLEAGLTYVTEDYFTVSDEEFISGRWAVNYDRYFYNKTLQLFHFHEGYGSFEDTDDWFIKSKTGIRIPIFTKINAALQFNLDWDNNPSPGRKHLDRALMITFGYLFER